MWITRIAKSARKIRKPPAAIPIRIAPASAGRLVKTYSETSVAAKEKRKATVVLPD